MTVRADFTGNIIVADGFEPSGFASVADDVELDPVAFGEDNVAAALGVAEGLITDAAEVADVTVTFTSGSAPATDGAITIADATAPTAVELLALIYELRAEVKAIKTALTL